MVLQRLGSKHIPWGRDLLLTLARSRGTTEVTAWRLQAALAQEPGLCRWKRGIRAPPLVMVAAIRVRIVGRAVSNGVSEGCQAYCC